MASSGATSPNVTSEGSSNRSTGDNASIGVEQDVGITLGKLRDECEQLWDKVKQEQAQILVNQRDPITCSGKDALVKILKEKEKRLIAELERVRNTDPKGYTDDPDIRFEILKEDLTQSISQLKTTLSLADNQHQDLTEEVKREEQVHQDLLSINKCLKDKLEEISSAQGHNVQTKETYLKELKEKVKKSETYNLNLTKQLRNFVSEHFPEPSEDTLDRGNRNLLSSARATLGHNMMSLQEILQEIINKGLEDPNSGYVLLDERFWPPYIELLLRCHIVTRHPTNDKQIRMVPFHL